MRVKNTYLPAPPQIYETKSLGVGLRNRCLTSSQGDFGGTGVWDLLNKVISSFRILCSTLPPFKVDIP